MNEELIFKMLTLSKEQAMNYLLRYHHLTDDTMLQGKEGILAYFAKVRTIQFDPLNVVGRNPDIVLFSRIQDYHRPMLDTLLYNEFKLMDHWDKNMSIIVTDDFAKLSWFREKRIASSKNDPKKIDFIINYIQENGPITSSDLPFKKKINAGFGLLVESTALLESMLYAGTIIVVKKIGNRRHYDLTEKYLPMELLQKQTISKRSSEAEYIYRRIQATGLMWNKPTDALLGRSGITKAIREAAFAELLAEKVIQTLKIDGIDATFYLPCTDEHVLMEMSSPILETGIRFIAPLDNFLWDRKLILALTGFDYKWEVYTPEKQRKFGYYVLPVLSGSTFIGRIEFDHFSKTKSLQIKHIWSEGQQKVTKKMLSSELQRLENYLKKSL